MINPKHWDKSGTAGGLLDAPLHDVLRASFPATFPRAASQDYFDGWVNSVLSNSGSTRVSRVGFEALVHAAFMTALALSGTWVLVGPRGVA